MIELPPKHWRPKPVSKYTPEPSYTDVDDEIFVFLPYGRALAKVGYNHGRKRTDIIKWDKHKHQAEYDSVITISPTLPGKIRTKLQSIIQSNWDAFIAEGVIRPVIGYEFCIDTGTSPPIACRRQKYGINEAKIIEEQAAILRQNNWTRSCPNGGYCSLIVLAPKPHQESVTNILDFVWRMCVSYRGLNAVTAPFEYPIPRNDEALDNFGVGAGKLYWISVDAKSGYHQIAVRQQDQEKLAFFLPNNTKETFTVMPFGPKNAPACYTVLMYIMRLEWEALFAEKFPELTDHTVDVHLIQHGDKQIVDDILLYSNCETVLLCLFECICAVFVKYRLSFNPKKCEFFLERIEWIGFDLRLRGNSPASSKYERIDKWPQPKLAESLISFIGLVTFYNWFIPWFETRIKVLRDLERSFHRSSIPDEAWNEDAVEAFQSIKNALTRDPCLARYDSSLVTVVKTDWSAIGMGFILMQPFDDAASREAAKILETTSEFTFDRLMTGARLQPVRFGSRRCTEMESHYHSFTGEVAAGRYAFAQLRTYLWGAKFYWVCDCSAVSQVTEYLGDIHQLRRWSQELLSYDYVFIHRPNRMMRDVDALSRGRHLDDTDATTLINEYESIASAQILQDRTDRKHAYDAATFPGCALRDGPTRNQGVATAYKHDPAVTLVCLPVCFGPTIVQSKSIAAASVVLRAVDRLVETRATLAWVSVDSRTGSIPWSLQANYPAASQMALLCANSDMTSHMVCSSLFPTQTTHEPFTNIYAALRHDTRNAPNPIQSKTTEFLQCHRTITGADFSCTFEQEADQREWVSKTLFIIGHLIEQRKLQCAVLLATRSRLWSFNKQAKSFCTRHGWAFWAGELNSSSVGDKVAAVRWVCVMHRHSPSGGNGKPLSLAVTSETAVGKSRYGDNIRPELNVAARSLFRFPGLPVPTMHGVQFSPYEATSVRQVYGDRTFDPSLPMAEVFDPDFPAPEPCFADDNNAFGCSFGVPFTDLIDANHVRPCHTREFLDFYSLPREGLSPTLIESPIQLLTPMLRTSCPFRLAAHVADKIIDEVFVPLLDDAGTDREAVVSCFIASARSLPTSSEWLEAYKADPDCNFILTLCSEQEGDVVTETRLRTIHEQLRPYVRERRFRWHQGRIVLHQLLGVSNKTLQLILVPPPLRHFIFSAYHSTPAMGHFGEYKTLHRIRLRFFWPNCRRDVTDWIAACPDCVLSNSKTHKSRELVYSYPASSPFYIIHVDIWQPGETLSDQGYGYFLGAMDDLTGFVIVAEFKVISSATIAALFMQQVLLKVGMCGMIRPDADSKFQGDFVSMCELLHIPCDPAARNNHKSVSVERFFKFANKALTIATNSHGSTGVSVEAIHVAAYAWNASVIDGTEIIRSVPAVGRPFRFPIDADLTIQSDLPVSSSEITNVHDFIRLGQEQSVFAQNILRLLTEDRRVHATEQINESRNPIIFKVNDIVAVKVQVHSNAAAGTVKKLSFQRRGPYVVVSTNGKGAYNVRYMYGPVNGSTKKYRGEDLNLLPPALYPCEPIDCADHRLLGIHHASVDNPFQHHLGIEGFNIQWLDGTVTSEQPPPVANPVVDPFILQDAIGPTIADTSELSHHLWKPTCDPQRLFQRINESIDRLFFVAYRNAGTLRPIWALVQVDLAQTHNVKAQCEPEVDGKYYVHFLSKPVADQRLSDPSSRWWPRWHEFTTSDRFGITYGAQVEIKPTRTPCSSKYIAWADVMTLTSPTVALIGPFDFQPIELNDPGRTPSYSQYVPLALWEELALRCPAIGINCPMLVDKRQERRNKRKRRS